jgi:hypothetical protein
MDPRRCLLWVRVSVVRWVIVLIARAMLKESLDLFHVRSSTSQSSQDCSRGRLEPVSTKGDCEGSQVSPWLYIDWTLIGTNIRRIGPTMVFERWQDAIKLGRITDAVIIGLQVGCLLIRWPRLMTRTNYMPKQCRRSRVWDTTSCAKNRWLRR